MSKRPLQVSPFLDAAQSTRSEVIDFHIWFSPGLSDAVEASTSGFLSLHRETKFVIGFDFAVTLSAPEFFCVLFDIASRQVVELKWLMLNRHRRWCHSSRVKFPLVSMSASWFLVSVYLIWILGSKLIRSNNQSRATLWVLETCLIVGLLLPFCDHLDHCFVVFKHIQQSFLTRRLDVWGNKNQHCPDHQSFHEISFVSEVCEVLHEPHVGSCTGLTVLDYSDTCFHEELRRSDPINQVRVIPSNLNPASKEMISDSVELCETEVCFLHIQLVGTNVWLPKMHNVSPDVDFESSRSPEKSESWNSPSLHCLAVFPTGQYCLYSHVWWM